MSTNSSFSRRDCPRVFVTGMGFVTPFGIGADPLLQAIKGGQCGVRKVTRFDVSDYSCQVAACIPESLDVAQIIPPKRLKQMDPSQALGVIAAMEALKHAELDPATVDRERFGVFMGSGLGTPTTAINIALTKERQNWRKITPHMGVQYSFSGASAEIAIDHDLRGPNVSICCACASGNAAIGRAVRAIQRGDADRILAGGADFVEEHVFVFFLRSRALATSEDPRNPNALRPFDRNRNGTIIADGAAVVMLESEKAARERGATIYGEILGMGETCDAYSMVRPRPDGITIARSITLALEDARLSPQEVEMVCAHGTGTYPNDPAEVKALKLSLGDQAFKVPVVGMKSITGHGLGASSAIELAASILCANAGIVPPTLHLEEPDPECDLDHVPLVAREMNYSVLLNLSFGFGGHNVVVAARAGPPR